MSLLEGLGYRIDDIRRMTPANATRILMTERDEYNHPKLKPSRPAAIDHTAQVCDVLFRRGWPQWRIEAKIKEMNRGK